MGRQFTIASERGGIQPFVLIEFLVDCRATEVAACEGRQGINTPVVPRGEQRLLP